MAIFPRWPSYNQNQFLGVEVNSLARAAFFAILFPVFAHADTLDEARETLANWGTAYCIELMSSNPAIKDEAARTLGAFFQRGAHNDEHAYANVRSYVKTAVQDEKLVAKETGVPMPLVTCLNMQRTTNYRKFIRKQDKYIN